MRNVLIHDYLMVDCELFHAVMVVRSYKFLTEFILKAQEQIHPDG